MKDNLNTPKKEKSTNKNNKPVSTKRKKSPGVTKKEERMLLESNKIEDSIINETPIVYNTSNCTIPSARVLEKKPVKLSLGEKFVNFIKLLLTYK